MRDDRFSAKDLLNLLAIREDEIREMTNELDVLLEKNKEYETRKRGLKMKIRGFYNVNDKIYKIIDKMEPVMKDLVFNRFILGYTLERTYEKIDKKHKNFEICNKKTRHKHYKELLNHAIKFLEEKYDGNNLSRDGM